MKITKIKGGKEESVVRQELSLQRRKEREVTSMRWKTNYFSNQLKHKKKAFSSRNNLKKLF
jgi:hypothetical protein